MTSDTAARSGTDLQELPKPGPMMLAMQGKGPIPQVDTEQIRERINERMLLAKTPEELVGAGKAYSLEDLAGVPLEVHTIVMRESTLQGEGLGVYVICDAVEGVNGAQIVFTTSAENVVRTLAIAHDRGWLPFTFKVRKAEKATERGYYPWIVESV